MAQLQALAGGVLHEGGHVLHLRADDKAGNSSSFDLTFTVQAPAPAVAANLARNAKVLSNYTKR